MKLSRFSKEGLRLYSSFLEQLRADPKTEPPIGLLERDDCTEALPGATTVSCGAFDNRLGLGKWLLKTVPDSFSRDQGLWAWLSLYLFDQLCPSDAEGRRRPKEQARLFPMMEDWKKYYRHLLVGPYQVCRAQAEDPDLAIGLLSLQPSKAGEVFEQVASRQERVINPGVVELVTRLYFDPDSKNLKRGAQGKGPGSPRRLHAFLGQLELTYDIASLGIADLLEFLPAEFNRFAPAV